MPPLPSSYGALGALYPSAPRGLMAAAAAAAALDTAAHPICSALVMAHGAVVTDVTDIPEDTVVAQLEHLEACDRLGGLAIGVLANHRTVGVAMKYAERIDGPVILDIEVSGPSGETVLTQRGLTALLDHLGVADVVLASRADAELAAGCEIRSLDDAQVAAQRLSRRGARGVVIKCGVLPARHFDTEPTGDTPFYSDLYFDGSDFALFEAPSVEADATGASAAHSAGLMAALLRGLELTDALQVAKQFATDALRLSAARPHGLAYVEAASLLSFPNHEHDPAA